MIDVYSNSRGAEEPSEDALVSEGLLHWLNWTLLLLSFSGWRDARRENSRKTSTREMSPVTGDTRVRPQDRDSETEASSLLTLAFKHGFR